jgi:hypothetical protein
MKEVWIQKIWKNALFDQSKLHTDNGLPIQIKFAGLYNYTQGPDFLQARVIINQIQWIGAVEIHQYSSDWYEHGHHLDEQYNSVVLHVVWENNQQVYRNDGTEIPQLVLEKYVNPEVLENILLLESFMNDFSCVQERFSIPNFIKHTALQSAAVHRLERRANLILQQIKVWGWEQSLHLAIARNFGGTHNGEIFYRIAQVIDIQMVQKMKSANENILAVFFGLSGLLECTETDEYIEHLAEDWRYLQVKYQLKKLDFVMFNWKGRPAQFPSMRLVQWAAYLVWMQDFTFFDEKPILPIADYWEWHYKPGKSTVHHSSQPGESFWDIFQLNCTLPARLAWQQTQETSDKTLSILDLYAQQPKENNRITRLFEKAGFTIENGMESQGCLELYENKCIHRKCHDCIIGNHLVIKKLVK